ncbi:MAG TPA: efflux RND transporter periplasmic adaptor subunit [Myxococcota bacterium]|nr:efflux RND transporter periplasmic adaptor subunit [Myxococcota bacterium]
MSVKKIIISVLLVGALAAVLVVNLGPKEKVKILVQTEKAKREPITQVVTASGKIRPETQVKVSADVGGYIRKLTVKDGDHVEMGSLLVEVDQQIYRARFKQTQAAEKTAEAQLALSGASLQKATGEARRVKGLYKKALISAAALEQAQADLAMAQAQVDASKGQLMQASATLDGARKDLAKCTITAPMSGVVIDLMKELGERVSGGDFREDIILTLADLSSMEVEVEVGERDVVLISEKDHTEIEVDAYPGKIIGGYVKEIANAGITRNQWTESEVTNFRVVIQVDESEFTLRPQMSATVKIETAHKDDSLTVPIQSVTLRRPSEISAKGEAKNRQGSRKESAGEVAARSKADGPKPKVDPQTATGEHLPVEVVFIVENGVAHAKKVKTGLSSDTRIEILDGVSLEEEVVSGPYRVLSKDLKNGSEVRVGSPETGKTGGRQRREK